MPMLHFRHYSDPPRLGLCAATGDNTYIMNSQSTAQPTRKRRSNAKDQLLQATSDILSQRSGIDVSLSEIAEKSGLNSALIKYHFGNKDGLLLALVERDAALSMDLLNKLVAMDVGPAKKVSLHITGLVNTYAKHPYLHRLIHNLMDSKEKSISEAMVEFFVKPLLAAEQKILSEGVESGVFREVDPTLFYYSIVGACDYIFYARHSRKFITGYEELTPALREKYTVFVSEIALRMLEP